MSSVNDVLGFLQFWREGDKTAREDPIAKSVAQAAESLLGKEAKLNLAREAILTEDLRHLAKADRAAVQRLREKVMGKAAAPAGGQGDDVGDLIIADDYCQIKSTNISWKPLLALALLLTALLGGVILAAWLFLMAPVGSLSPAKPAVPPVAQQWWEVEETRQPDGTWKETGRKKFRLADGKAEEVK